MPIKNGNADLQYGRERHPQCIGQLHPCDPRGASPDCMYHPRDSEQDDEDVDGCKEITLKLELD